MNSRHVALGVRLFVVAFLLGIAVLCSPPAMAQTDQWENTLPGTAGGGLAVSSQNPLVAYHSGYNGIWKTTDGGQSWTSISNGILTPYDNQAIWVSTKDDQIVYVSDYNHGWYRSIDGGNSWQNIFSSPAQSIPGWSVLAPSNDNVLYIHTYSTVYRSTNASKPKVKFQALDATCQGTIITAVDPKDPDIAYFIGNPSGATLKTTDGGKSCFQISPLRLTVRTEFGKGGRLYGFTQNPWAIYSSDDRGDHWTLRAGNGFPTGQDIWGFAVDPNDRDHLLVSATSYGIRESRDGGDSWSPLNSGYPIGSERSVILSYARPGTYYASTNGNGVWRYQSTRLSKGFDYPISDVYRPTREAGDADGWYVANSFGNDLAGSPCTAHIHPGDDWNRDDENDARQDVKAVADGKVFSIKKKIKVNGEVLGQGIAIVHPLLDGTSVYSVYIHVEVKPGLSKGDPVSRGEPIAMIADVQAINPHLHFEMRTSMGKDWYPNDDGCGYYADLTAMQNEGFIDPVGFIDANRP